MTKEAYSDKSLGRAYAFKFIYHLFLKEFEADKKALLEDEVKLNDIISEFEESFMAQDEEHLNNGLNPSIQRFGRSLILGTLRSEEELISKISPLVQRRSFGSVEPMERSLLQLAAYEILKLETPKKVVINEYLNINKEFGQGETNSFLNALLDKLSN